MNNFTYVARTRENTYEITYKGEHYIVTLNGRHIVKDFMPPFSYWQNGIEHFYGANSSYVPYGALKALIRRITN